MAPVIVDPSRVHEFAGKDGFYAWLADHHASEPEIWVRILKKASGKSTISPVEAIDAALCWGWIDAIRKSWDEESFVQRYVPRGRKSVWSQINRDNVERLVAEGRMTEHGLKHVEAAKADGRWAAAYKMNMEAPAELLAAIEASPAAKAAYGTLSSQNRFALTFRLGSLKTQGAREKKIRSFVDMLERGETIYPQKPPK